MIAHDVHLRIGSLLFEGVDQIDLTGPFEVLSRIPNSTYRIYAQDHGAGARPQGVAADAGCHAGRGAAARCAACAGRLRPGSLDGGRRGARLDPPAGGGGLQHLLGLHRRVAVRRGRPAEGTPGDNALGVVSSAAVFRRYARERACGHRRKLRVCRRRHRGDRRRVAARRASCAATTRRGRSSSTWPMRRSRRSTAARRNARHPRSCNRHVRRPARSRRSGKRPRAAWRPGWASSCRRLSRRANCPARRCSWRRRRPCPR